MKDILLTSKAREHLRYFAANERKLLIKIFDLFDAITREPFTGIGKPEPLRGDLQGYWSRRVNDEHRIVYKVTSDSIIIISCRSHYNL